MTTYARQPNIPTDAAGFVGAVLGTKVDLAGD